MEALHLNRSSSRMVVCAPPIVVEGLRGLGCEIVAHTGFLQQVPLLVARTSADVVLLHCDAALAELAYDIAVRLRANAPRARVILMLPEPQLREHCEVLAHDCDAASLQVILGVEGRMPGIALTSREVEALRLVADGLTNRAIAQRMGLAENTVKNYLRHVHQKLDVRSRTEAVVVAARAGYAVVRAS